MQCYYIFSHGNFTCILWIWFCLFSPFVHYISLLSPLIHHIFLILNQEEKKIVLLNESPFHYTQIWFTRFNAAWKLFTHLWLSANKPSQLSWTIYFLFAVGKMHRYKIPISYSENLFLALVFALYLLLFVSGAVTQCQLEQQQQQHQQLQHHTDSCVHLRVFFCTRLFAEFLCNTQGNFFI